MSKLKLSIVQSHTFWHDPQANRELFGRLILNYQQESDIFLLPEVFTSGFTMDASPYAETMDGKSVSAMKMWAAEKNAAILGSLLISEKGKTFNRLVCAFPDGSHLFYDKKHLFTYSQEDEIVSGGKTRLVFSWRNWKICPLICYDLRFPAWARNNEAFDLLVYVANWPAARSYAWSQLLKARAIENQCYCAGANRTGEDGRGLQYAGDSVILDYKGKELIHCQNKVGIYTYELNKAPLLEFRSQYPFLKDQDHFTFQNV